MSFRFPVALYLDSVRQGLVTFHSLFVTKVSDYACEPDGLLVYDEAKNLLRQIRQAPLSQEGTIGKFAWRV